MANTVFHILADFFARWGYWVVFFGVMAENIGVPVPGETVLLFAGFLSYQGRMHILPAVLTAIAGATAGAVLGYGLGWYGGPPLVYRCLRRFPRLSRQYEDAQQRFVKHGQWAVFGARFVTGLRVFAGLLAGALRMPFATFCFFSFAGAVCWALVIGWIGLLFGSNWGKLVSFVGRMDRIALAMLAAGVLLFFLFRTLRRKKLS